MKSHEISLNCRNVKILVRIHKFFGFIVYCGYILGSFSVMSLLYNPIPSLSFVNPKKDDKMERHELILFCFVILLLNSALFLFGPILLTDPFIHSSVIIRFTDNGRSMKPFSSQNFWAWADNLGRYILGHLGYFQPIYQRPFWYCESLVHVFH